MIGAMLAPSVFTRLLVPQAPMLSSTFKLGVLITVAAAEISTPLLLTEPWFLKIDVPQPQLGGNVTAMSASCDSFEKYVNDTRAESGRNSTSNPPSASLVRSGCNAELPRLPIVMPGTSVLLMTTGVGLKNCKASVGPGCNPELPYAARSFNASSQLGFGKNGSSDATHDADSRGYRMLPKLFPNEVLSSLRSAPVTNNRFL